jgi:hypothetical protein
MAIFEALNRLRCSPGGERASSACRMLVHAVAGVDDARLLQMRDSRWHAPTTHAPERSCPAHAIASMFMAVSTSV